MRENPSPVIKRMRVFDAGAADSRTTYMGHNRFRIDTSRLAAEMLAMKRRPDLFFYHRNAIRIIRNAPAVAVCIALHVRPALSHQRIL